MEFQDKTLQCADCGQDFVFTAGEQEFYERKGFKEIPKRCKPCREARKARRADGGSSNGSRSNGGSWRPSGDVDGNRAPRQREMFDATCAQCGAPARVPFRPMAGRPVYCRDCYAQHRGEGY
ncbi:MAG TPA: zinc-ribbon domain containing protein [Polyangia bacterium]|nr:zinc-ribbon domain containing protein [Polyangia bacterium]